ncbi:MAG: C1 family peptidase [Pseudomonadota bacterium]
MTEISSPLVDLELQFRNGAQTVRMGGYLPDIPKPESAEVVTDRTVENLPPQVDLRADCTQVEDQKRIGSCAANAVVGALEYHRKKNRIDPSDLSRLFVYYNTRRLRGTVDTDSGSTLSEAIAALLAFGAPRSDLWPYDDQERWKKEPPKEVYENALLNEAVQYARVSPGAGALGAVAAGFPVAFGMRAPVAAYNTAALTGAMPELTQVDWAGPIAPGHAMLIVGYDLLRRHFIVRNSYGEMFGDGGYFTLPFSVLDQGGMKESYWVVGQLEQQGGVTIRQPVKDNTADEMRKGLRSELESEASKARSGLRDRLTRR